MKKDTRYICFDTETTGTSIVKGHRIIEIGCVEIFNGLETGKEFRILLNPEKEVDKEAEAVHGYNLEMLKNEKKFHEIADDFLNFIKDGILVIHNAGFDMTFINNELEIAGYSRLENEVIDTLILARKNYVGEKASLDAMCNKFNVDTSSRTHHGALLDSQLLSKVFIQMSKEIEVHIKKLKFIKNNQFIRTNYENLTFANYE